MSIYAISDLHLSGEPAKKPMDIFGEHWTNHKEKVKENVEVIIMYDDLGCINKLKLQFIKNLKTFGIN